ncbi:hypothetical protein SVAN01_07971 [Stagonosporopsis vannaccii]|nr:hypothetical protein SVAN01_07971 [Stagonosporopsis vannaccii]
MKYCWNFLFIGLALCLSSFVDAVPALVVEAITAAIGDTDPRSAYHALNVTFADNTNIIEARGYDHSTEWQGYALVEVWTGGDQRRPVNWGNVRGSKLSDQVFRLLDTSCPWESTDANGACSNNNWQWVSTKTLVEDEPSTAPFRTEMQDAYFKTENAIFATPGIRTLMAKIIAETLAAYTKNEKEYNCYNYAGEVFCNVPRKVRPLKGICRNMPNRWHILTSSADPIDDFSPFGELRPCKMRPEVDKVMEEYRDDIMKEFPKSHRTFSRDARVIISGDQVCSGEP